MITEEKQDELIFDFLEGNLSPDEEEAFLILKDESEILNREVRLWQNTYLQEPLPSVEALEQKLVIQKNRDTGRLSTRIYAIMLIGMTLIAAGDSFDKYIAGSIPQSKAQLTPSQETTAPISNLVPEYSEKVTSVGRQILASPESKENIAPLTDRLATGELFALPVLKGEELMIKPQAHTLEDFRFTRPEKDQRTHVQRKWSRHEQRLIRKKIWQDHRSRKVNEFRSGNEPYVVPLNTSNF